MNAPSSLAEYAVDYARRGWAVFPCSAFSKRPLVGRDVDANGEEIPNTGGVKKATTDPDQITAWWKQFPNAMIGVAMGPYSGVWAIDPDAPKKPGAPDGKANWAALKLKHGCPHTHTHLTPGGGEHLLFKWRPDRPLTNSEGNITGTGINVRGDGGYVIAPPSRRHDGKAYEIAEPLDFFHFAEAPEWLYEMLRPKKAADLVARHLAAIELDPRHSLAERSHSGHSEPRSHDERRRPKQGLVLGRHARR